MDSDKQPSKRQFTLLALLGLIGGIAITFAATRLFGAYGFVFGGFAVTVIVGWMFSRRDLIWGGIAGMVTLTSCLLILWGVHGKLRKMDYQLVAHVEMRFQFLNDAIDDYQTANGALPEALTQLPPGDHVDDVDYQTDGQTYRLVYLGMDAREGGELRDRDIPEEALPQIWDARIGFRSFMTDYQASNALLIALIASLFSAVAVTRTFAIRTDRKVLYPIAFGGYVVVSILMGFLMAGLHIVASQSGH